MSRNEGSPIAVTLPLTAINGNVFMLSAKGARERDQPSYSSIGPRATDEVGTTQALVDIMLELSAASRARAIWPVSFMFCNPIFSRIRDRLSPSLTIVKTTP
jgi:hypothetical protein